MVPARLSVATLLPHCHGCGRSTILQPVVSVVLDAAVQRAVAAAFDNDCGRRLRYCYLGYTGLLMTRRTFPTRTTATPPCLPSFTASLPGLDSHHSNAAYPGVQTPAFAPGFPAFCSAGSEHG